MNSPAIRYHGGKWRLAPWILSFFPTHRCYVEPFGGAASVLLQKNQSYAEVYNDLDGDMVNFFRVLRDPVLCQRLVDACVLTPFAREEHELAHEPSDDPVERARRLAVRAAMGFGSAGATKGTTGFRIDTRKSYGTAQHLWVRYPECLGAIGQRMTGVLIENRPAVDVMLQQDGPDVLHYADPPYVLSTRDPRASRPGSKYYRHEMTDADHHAFLDTALGLEGMVVISGYANDLYADRLGMWTRHDTESRISSGRGTAVRTETVWLNAACVAALRQPVNQKVLWK